MLIGIIEGAKDGKGSSLLFHLFLSSHLLSPSSSRSPLLFPPLSPVVFSHSPLSSRLLSSFSRYVFVSSFLPNPWFQSPPPPLPFVAIFVFCVCVCVYFLARSWSAGYRCGPYVRFNSDHFGCFKTHDPQTGRLKGGFPALSPSASPSRCYPYPDSAPFWVLHARSLGFLLRRLALVSPSDCWSVLLSPSAFPLLLLLLLPSPSLICILLLLPLLLLLLLCLLLIPSCAPYPCRCRCR